MLFEQNSSLNRKVIDDDSQSVDILNMLRFIKFDFHYKIVNKKLNFVSVGMENLIADSQSFVCLPKKIKNNFENNFRNNVGRAEHANTLRDRQTDSEFY